MRNFKRRGELPREALGREGVWSAGTLSRRWIFRAVLGIAVLPAALTACRTRPASYDAPTFTGDGDVFSLEGALVAWDKGLNRLMFLRSPKAGALEVKTEEIGESSTIVVSPNKKQLFVLNRGGSDVTKEDNERPSLTVFDGGVKAKTPVKIELNTPMNGLALDEKNEWLAAYDAEAFVRSAAEFQFLDLAAASSGEKPKLIPKTIRQFGYGLLGMEFSPELTLPSGKKRFFAVRSKGDVTLVDLNQLADEEVTIKLPESDKKVPYQPVELAFDDGESDDNSDARIGIRLDGTSDVMLLTLRAAASEKESYSVLVNIVNVGGIPSEIEFVHTDGGLRLAALVPEKSRATLVDPETMATEVVDLGAGFTRMTKITDSVSDAPEGGDVALLWGANERFGFWSLGSTSATPYASVETTTIDFPVTEVLNVPSATNGHLRILVGESKQFFVLNLLNREATPLTADSGSSLNVEVSPDGEYVWVTESGTSVFSAVSLANLHPEEIHVEPAMTHLADVARASGGRSLIVLHGFETSISATLFDRKALSSVKSTYFPFLELEGLQ